MTHGNGKISRGDILIANFDTVRGSEQGKIRPALVIQNDIGNTYSPTTIVAAITSQTDVREYPTNVFLSKVDSNLDKDSTILLNQIRTIDKSRIAKIISSLDSQLMRKVDAALRVSLGLND